MNKSKEITYPIIRIDEINEVLDVADYPSDRTYEIVLPPCQIENPMYIPADADVLYALSSDRNTFFQYIPVWEIAGKTLFGYDVRYDPNAHAMDVLPKQVEEPLPFEILLDGDK